MKPLYWVVLILGALFVAIKMGLLNMITAAKSPVGAMESIMADLTNHTAKKAATQQAVKTSPVTNTVASSPPAAGSGHITTVTSPVINPAGHNNLKAQTQSHLPITSPSDIVHPTNTTVVVTPHVTSSTSHVVEAIKSLLKPIPAVKHGETVKTAVTQHGKTVSTHTVAVTNHKVAAKSVSKVTGKATQKPKAVVKTVSIGKKVNLAKHAVAAKSTAVNHPAAAAHSVIDGALSGLHSSMLNNPAERNLLHGGSPGNVHLGNTINQV